ncbi:hypothetical protein BDW71DRAFT_216569 [Aspergillus fruticulosus]
MPIGVAIIGAGLFGKDQYFPAIRDSPFFDLKAVYSHSQGSAVKFGVAASTDAYFDKPPTARKTLTDLLNRNDIEAVIIALPIPAQPDIIRAALKSGKHVLSEKPIAKDMNVAKQLMTEYAQYKDKGIIWSVAENFRFLKPIVYGVEQLKRLGGTVTSFQISVHDLIHDGNPYYATEWRKNPQYPGGFILDAGVHFLAGLREFLGAVDDSIANVAAFGTQIQPHLPPVDTMSGILQLRSGVSGTISLSYATEFKNDFFIEVATTNGSVSMSPAGVTVIERGSDGLRMEKTEKFESSTGVAIEVGAFGRSIADHEGNAKLAPEEALLDLKLVELLLKSAEEGGAVQSI